MLVTVKYQFILSFPIGMIEGAVTEAIDFALGDAQIIIHPPTFAERPAIYQGSVHGLPDPPELIIPDEDNILEFRKRVLYRQGGKAILKVNMIPIDVTKDVNVTIIDDKADSGATGESSDVDSVFYPTAEKALNIFLELCRFRTGYVSIVFRGHLEAYSCACYIDGEPMATKVNYFASGDLPSYIDKEAFDLISCDLRTGYEVPLSKNLLLDSRSLLRANLRMALVQAVTALEVGLSVFLRNCLHVRGVDTDDRLVDQIWYVWSREEHLRRKLEIAIALLPDDLQDEIEAKRLQKQCNKAIDRRNKVVHEGADIPANEVGAIKKRIDAIGEMINYLDSQIAND